jgi:YVTN family beta-propeller protein
LVFSTGYDENVPAAWRFLLTLLTLSTSMAAQTYSAPAGIRPALRRPGASILPGGRIVSPLGDQYVTGPGAFGLAVSPSGKTVVTSNGGPGRNSLTILDRDRNGHWQGRQLVARSLDMLDQFDAADWRGVFMGLAFSTERAIYASEGNSGKIRLFDWNNDRRRVIDLNQKGFDDSYTGDLALDTERGVLYAVDQANFRVAVIDIKTRQILTSVKVGRLPFALALSPDRQKLYVTNVGTFQYQAIPGADPAEVRTTGLPFPAFGFPSAESAAGAERVTGKGTVKVPGLGDPNAPESNSVCVIDVSTPAAARVETFIRTGLPIGENNHGGSSPSGIVATSDRVFVSNANQDSITIIDIKTNTVTAEVPLRIPGLEAFRGILPIGMAYHEKSGWLLVAEGGINAVGVIDTREKRMLGHLPVAWFPTCVAIDHDTVFVASAKAYGTGPSAPGGMRNAMFPTQLEQGSLSVFPLPKAEDLADQTAFVMQANGFRPSAASETTLPVGIRHVILIVKESRAYDQVFGDILSASNGAAMGSPEIARLGTRGYVDGKGKFFSLKDVNVTPNHHAIARRWAFSDNFYADSDISLDGHHWLVGSYPNAWTESSMLAANSDQKKDFRLSAAPGRLSFAAMDASVHPEEQGEAGTIWHHLTRHGVSFFNFGEGFELAGVGEGKDMGPAGARWLTNMPMPEPLYRNTSRRYPGFNMNIPDQYRASQFIQEMDEKYVKGAEDLPQFVFLQLPNDYAAPPRPEQGYPYEESFVADNDYALGRIVEYLSGTKWWKETVVFVTEDDAQGGLDHIDAHRTLLLCAGPWCKKNYVSHVNTSFPGLLKTIFRLLHVPPLNLFDAAASDLSDCLASAPDPSPWKAVELDKRIFDPAAVRESK